MVNTTIFSGTIPMTYETGNRAVSKSGTLSSLILEDEKKYAFRVDGSHEVVVEASEDDGDITAGPINIGGVQFTIVTSSNSSIVTAESMVKIGQSYVDAPAEITMHVDEVANDQPTPSGGGVMRITGTSDDVAGTITLDKTWQEIKDAVENGLMPYLFTEVNNEDELSYNIDYLTRIARDIDYDTYMVYFGEFFFLCSSADSYPETEDGGEK